MNAAGGFVRICEQKEAATGNGLDGGRVQLKLQKKMLHARSSTRCLHK